MGLVAAGLVLIIARIALGKSNRWLLAANLLALSATLYACCFVNFAALIARLQCRAFIRNDRARRQPRQSGTCARSAPPPSRRSTRFLASPADSGNPAVPDIAGWRADDERWYRGDMQKWRAWSFRDWRLMRYLDERPPCRDAIRRLRSYSRLSTARKSMPHHILVADDDPHIREVICFALEKAGMATAAVADGAAALRAFERGTPDLVVLDVGMPEMDGLEVCRLLRRTSDVPILFLSARDEEIDRILGLEMGGDDYVTKPFSPRELVARVNVILRRARAVAGRRWRCGSRSRMAVCRSIRHSRAVGFGDTAAGAHGDRIRDPEAPDDAPGACAQPQPADGRQPCRQHPCLRPHRRQPHPQHPRQVRRGRLRPMRSRRCTASASGSAGAARESGSNGGRASRFVVLAILLTVMALPLVGLFFFRHLREPADPPDRGRADRPGCGDRRDLCAARCARPGCRPTSSAPRSPPRPIAAPARRRAETATGRSSPASTLPSTAMLGPRPDPLPATPDPAFAAIGARLSGVLAETQRTTLAGFRLLDPAGMVIAGGGDVGRSFAARRGGARRTCRPLRQRAAQAGDATGRRRRSIR